MITVNEYKERYKQTYKKILYSIKQFTMPTQSHQCIDNNIGALNEQSYILINIFNCTSKEVEELEKEIEIEFNIDVNRIEWKKIKEKMLTTRFWNYEIEELIKK